MIRQYRCHPLVIAVLLTVFNACKSVAVDDTAYLTIARHIAHHPGDPYGFEMFWYSAPQPAMEVLVPPVLPYWLGLGIALFGENELLLKLWLFPFAALLTYSLRSLARRFAAGTESIFVPLVCFSGVVLPLFGFMLDLPALALSLTSIALFAKPGKVNLLLSGVALALAMQTKYTAIVCPAVIVWYGISFRRFRESLVVVTLGVLLFAAWEAWLHSRYGQSHFLFHAGEQRSSDSNWLDDKLGLVVPLLSHLGGLAIGLALLTSRAAEWWKGMDWFVGIFAVSTLIAVAVLQGHASYLVARNAFPIVGALFIVAVGISVFKIGIRDEISRFLIGWLLLEFAAYIVLTPFPAGRRVIGFAIISALIFARNVSLSQVRLPSLGVLAVAPLMGFSIFAIDAWDTRPEKRLAQTAQKWLEGKGGNVWFNGHWGFQYYCERGGMKSVDVDRSLLDVGDWLVFPEIPDDGGFYRPYHGGAHFKPDERFLTRVAEWTSDDILSATTIPTLYGGYYPLLGRYHPRLKIVIYKVNEPFVPKRIEDEE